MGIGDDYAFSSVGIYYQAGLADTAPIYDAGQRLIPSTKGVFGMSVSSSPDPEFDGNYYLTVWSVRKDSTDPDKDKVPTKVQVTKEHYELLQEYYGIMYKMNVTPKDLTEEDNKKYLDISGKVSGFLSKLRVDIPHDNVPVHERKSELPKEKIKIK